MGNHPALLLENVLPGASSQETREHLAAVLPHAPPRATPQIAMTQTIKGLAGPNQPPYIGLLLSWMLSVDYVVPV